jgi:hypothetical protein
MRINKVASIGHIQCFSPEAYEDPDDNIRDVGSIKSLGVKSELQPRRSLAFMALEARYHDDVMVRTAPSHCPFFTELLTAYPRLCRFDVIYLVTQLPCDLTVAAPNETMQHALIRLMNARATECHVSSGGVKVQTDQEQSSRRSVRSVGSGASITFRDMRLHSNPG